MSNKKEYAIGDTVQMGLLTLVCEQQPTEDRCYGCYFDCATEECPSNKIIGCCGSMGRNDNKDVIFKLKTE